MAKNELAPLVTQLEARTARFERQLERATRKVSGETSKQSHQWKKHHKKMDSRFKAMGKSMATGMAFGTAAITAGLAAVTRKALAAADRIEHFSKQTGVSAETLQEYAYIANRLGLSQDDMNKAFEMGTKGLGEYVTKGTGPAADAIKKLGLEQEIASGKISNAGDLLDRMNEILEGNNSALDKAGIAGQLFGTRYGVKLVEALSQGKDGIAEMKKEARALGAVIDNDMIKRGSQANDALGKLGDVVRGNLNNAILEAAPAIEDLAETLAQLGPEMAAWFANVVKFASDAADGWVEAFGRMQRASTALNFAKSGNLKLAGASLDLMRTEAQLQEATARMSEEHAENLKKQLGFMKAIKKAESEGDKRGVKNNTRWLNRMREKADAISDEREKLEARIAQMASGDESGPAPLSPSTPKPEAPSSSSKGVSVDSDSKAKEDALKREIELIEELGRTEQEQIKITLDERLASIDAAKLGEVEAAELRAKAHAAAVSDTQKLKAEKDKIAQDELTALETQRAIDFEANQDKLAFLAEIQAIRARVAGDGITATRLEMDAVRERYEAELSYLDEVIKSKGSTPELEADRASLMASLEQNRADRVEFERITLDEIDAMTNNESRLENALAFIDKVEQAKLARLADYYGQTEALNAEHQDRMDAINEEAEDARKDTKKQALAESYDDFTSALSATSQALRDAGMEDTKAGKAIAKAQQVTAIGEAIVNTGKGVSKALSLGPVGIPIAAAIGALGAVQVGAMASQTFDGGGATSRGPRAGGVDGKGGYHAIVHPNEVIADMSKPGREINGQSIADYFGMDAPTAPNFKASAFSSVSQSAVNVAGATITINGNADSQSLARLESMLANDRKNRAKEFNAMANQRDKRLTSRQNRRVGM